MNELSFAMKTILFLMLFSMSLSISLIPIFLNYIVKELRVASHRDSIRNAAKVIGLIAKEDALLDHQSFEMVRQSAAEIVRLTK